MQRLQIELILRLDWYEPHRWPVHCLGDRFGVPVIILIGFHEGTYELRRNQPHLMPLSLQRGTEVMGATTGFYANQAGRHICCIADHLFPRQSLLHDHVSWLVETHHVKSGLSKIDTDRSYFHLN